MADKRFIVISEKGVSFSKETVFDVYSREREVIDMFIRANNIDVMADPIEIVRIFSVDEYGRVTHYMIETSGFTFKLKPIPGEAK